MTLVTFSVYRTIVVDQVATGDSELVEITIDDADDDGAITRDEWVAYTNDSAGHIGGNVGGVAALWDGETGATNEHATGTLYTKEPITGGSSVQEILDTIQHAPKYSVGIDDLSVCFVAGTMITTAEGERPVEKLRPGDLVLTRDHGPQPLVWVGHERITEHRLDCDPSLRPIRIRPGAMDGGLPYKPVKVSGQHRILIAGPDGREYLVAARHLQASGARGFSVVKDGKPFTLVHIAFANHEIVKAEGAPMESFFTGPMALRALPLNKRIELCEIFPSLAIGENPMSPARPFVRRRDVLALLQDEELVE